jgi:hypothetical protein
MGLQLQMPGAGAFGGMPPQHPLRQHTRADGGGFPFSFPGPGAPHSVHGGQALLADIQMRLAAAHHAAAAAVAAGVGGGDGFWGAAAPAADGHQALREGTAAAGEGSSSNGGRGSFPT